jgi:hypothetical protein
VSGFDRILWIATATALAGAVLSFVLVRARDFERPVGPVSLREAA